MRVAHLGAAAALLALPLLAGCANMQEIGRAPTMSAVGVGLVSEMHPIPVVPKDRAPRAYQSVWNDGADFYRDPRATKIGDVVTVNISIDEKARLDNKTDRSRDSKTSFNFDFMADLLGKSGTGNLETNVDSQSSTKGAGKIDRTEEIKLSVATMVTDVLPNGNLLISGSQEVRVNYEMRVLNVAGIVRPRDISRSNTISYEKIAEARISYGGRGRLMEVQQPAVGHQVYDNVVPF